MSSNAIALRLDEKTRRRLSSAAHRHRKTRSEVLRKAIDVWLENDERETAARPFDLVKDLIGSIDGGDPDRSADVGRKVAAKLREARKRPVR